MSSPFVWFDNISAERGKTTDFLSQNFGWSTQDIGPMTFLTTSGDMPFAATCDEMPGMSGWVPYIEVQDLNLETDKARTNGAEVIAENLVGPAGTATFLRDPGGSVLAIWKRAAS